MLINEFLLYIKKRGLEIVIVIAVSVVLMFAFERMQESMINVHPLVPFLIIVFAIFIVLSLVYDAAQKNVHAIPFKRWNDYIEEARNFRTEHGYTSFENIPHFLENKYYSLIIREADIENSLNMIIRIQNKNNNKCYEIYTCKDNIEELRALFNIWTILLIYFNDNTTFNDIILWVNTIIRAERDIPEAWRIYI